MAQMWYFDRQASQPFPGEAAWDELLQGWWRLRESTAPRPLETNRRSVRPPVPLYLPLTTNLKPEPNRRAPRREPIRVFYPMVAPP